MAGKEVKKAAADVDDIVKMLDSFASSDEGRMKVKVSEDVEAGSVKKEYHLGRCDIGSAFACGIPFDVIEDVYGDDKKKD